MSSFVHLHLHSEYSLLDGACRITDIPARAKACGQNAVAITDHGSMYGAVAFYRACRENDIKPIIGCEVYVAPRSRYEKASVDGENYHHLVLLCKNEIGYKNLIYMVSKGFTEGFFSKPRIDAELLSGHSEGLIALSGCLAGKIPRLLSSGRYDDAFSYALEMKNLFGEDNFFIEIQNHGLSEQIQILPMLAKLAREAGLGLVATNDVHYLTRADAHTQKVLMCIQTNSTVDDDKAVGFETDEFYFKNSDEMKLLFADYEGALENTVKIAQRCNFDFDFSHIFLPAFKTPDGVSPGAFLETLARQGLKEKLDCGLIEYSEGKHSEEEYEKRLKYELGVIDSMGYSDYFLIVADYVNFAKNRKIPVGPGRGSGCGSLVAFLTGITDIDPIRFDLLFERFLNPERVSMPDIDMDFCYNRRDEVIEYVGEKYGRDYVSQIITFGTLAARAAVRDVGRALGMPYSEVDRVAKLIPQEHDITLKAALALPEIKSLYDSDDRVRKLIDTACAIEGMPRNVSIHAAGIVITDSPIWSYVPLSVSNGAIITQYDMDTIAQLGLLKFDFLALRYLTIINDAWLQIREKEPSFDLEKIPLDDKATYDMLSEGQTLGIFQLESGGMRAMLRDLRPDSIDDIIAAIALYRPGPMESIPKYIEGRHNPCGVTYRLPCLEPILKSTYGCVVYQEQVMSICREVAGFTYGHADIVRRAMSKKKAAALNAERDGFISGAMDRGISEKDATALFDELASFANYAFNKSHAAAYSIISYRTAYLKAHYPKEFFAALLTSVLGNQAKVAEYIAECAKHRIKVLPPDINESRMLFHVSGENIRFGLLALKNVGRQFVAAIIDERQHSGRPFSSFEDFAERMCSSGADLNKRQVETLIKAGAFDSLGVYRSRLVASFEQLLETLQSKSRSNLDGQLDMFSSITASEPIRFEYPELEEFSFRELLMLEKESSGMYFSGHLLDGYSKNIEALSTVPISELVGNSDENGDNADLSPTYKLTDKKRVRIAGIINSVTVKITKKDERMAFFRVEDRFAEIECIAFPRQLTAYSDIIRPDTAVCVDGEISLREEENAKIIVSSVSYLTENSRFNEEKKAPLNNTSKAEESVRNEGTVKGVPYRLFVRVPDLECEKYLKASNLVDIFTGGTQVVFYDMSTQKYVSYSAGANVDNYLLGRLTELLGEENVVVKYK